MNYYQVLVNIMLNGSNITVQRVLYCNLGDLESLERSN